MHVQGQGGDKGKHPISLRDIEEEIYGKERHLTNGIGNIVARKNYARTEVR